MRSTFGSRVVRAGLPTISGLLGVPLYRGHLVFTQRTFFQFRCFRLRELQGYGRRALAYGSWRICGFLVLTRCTRDASAQDTANFCRALRNSVCATLSWDAHEDGCGAPRVRGSPTPKVSAPFCGPRTMGTQGLEEFCGLEQERLLRPTLAPATRLACWRVGGETSSPPFAAIPSLFSGCPMRRSGLTRRGREFLSTWLGRMMS